jgi:chloramphenicol 3-O-phosphotransferase
VACAAFAGIDLFAVRVFCLTAMAMTREHARSDRFDGAVVAFATHPEPTIDVAMEIDTSDLDPSSCARQILDRFERRHLS